jgi:BMFP domain-containing protein YqiC
MDPLDQLDNLAKRLSSLIPEPLQATQQDLESNLRSGLESGLRKMNLVTREEFDVQNAVLLRTREKLEALEKRISMLEANE